MENCCGTPATDLGMAEQSAHEAAINEVLKLGPHLAHKLWNALTTAKWISPDWEPYAKCSEDEKQQFVIWVNLIAKFWPQSLGACAVSFEKCDPMRHFVTFEPKNGDNSNFYVERLLGVKDGTLKDADEPEKKAEISTNDQAVTVATELYKFAGMLWGQDLDGTADIYFDFARKLDNPTWMGCTDLSDFRLQAIMEREKCSIRKGG